MVQRLTDDPPMMRGAGDAARRPGALGGVDPIGVRPPIRRRRGPDWGLVLITLAFLGGAGGLMYFGYHKLNGSEAGLAEGESRIITARPDTVIPDVRPGTATPAATGGTGTAGATPAPAPAASGGGYSLNDQAQGGDVSTRPDARTAPEPAGRPAQRPTSSAPGVLQAPPGVKPVK